MAHQPLNETSGLVELEQVELELELVLVQEQQVLVQEPEWVLAQELGQELVRVLVWVQGQEPVLVQVQEQVLVLAKLQQQN
jgi:hypothetical protein